MYGVKLFEENLKTRKRDRKTSWKQNRYWVTSDVPEHENPASDNGTHFRPIRCRLSTVSFLNLSTVGHGIPRRVKTTSVLSRDKILFDVPLCKFYQSGGKPTIKSNITTEKWFPNILCGDTNCYIRIQENKFEFQYSIMFN